MNKADIELQELVANLAMLRLEEDYKDKFTEDTYVEYFFNKVENPDTDDLILKEDFYKEFEVHYQKYSNAIMAFIHKDQIEDNG